MAEPTHLPGRIVWHELMTSDVPAAKAFYSELFGWNISEIDMGGGPYTMIMAGEDGIGGLFAKPAEMEAPDTWVGYISGDPKSVAARTNAFGGQILMPPTEVPPVGAFVVVADPQGSVIAAWKSNDGDTPGPEMPPPGHFCWGHLYSDNVMGSVSFYKMAFGMQVEPAGGDMMLKSKDGAQVGSIGKPREGMGNHWSHYVAVADVEASTKRAQELGGKCVLDVQPIENIGRFSIVSDPTGAEIALFQFGG